MKITLLQILNLLCSDETIIIWDNKYMTNKIFVGNPFRCKCEYMHLLNCEVFQIIGHDDALEILLRGE